jgi:monoamine oxidase
MTLNSKILIIGAGAAGIAAAAHLLEKGFKNLLILEAKNRIGGRIHTVKFCKYSNQSLLYSFINKIYINIYKYMFEYIL